MEDKKITVRQEWIDSALDLLDKEELKEYIYGIVMYGLYDEKINPESKTVKMSLNLIYPNIDRITNYKQKFEGGGSSKENGRPQKYDAVEVWQLCQEFKTGREVANALEAKYGGEVNLKGLYSNKGWINRKDPNFLGGIEENPTSKKDFTF